MMPGLFFFLSLCVCACMNAFSVMSVCMCIRVCVCFNAHLFAAGGPAVKRKLSPSVPEN